MNLRIPYMYIKLTRMQGRDGIVSTYSILCYRIPSSGHANCVRNVNQGIYFTLRFLYIWTIVRVIDLHVLLYISDWKPRDFLFFSFSLSLTFILQFPSFCKIICTEEETKSQPLLFVMQAHRYNITKHKNLIILLRL